VLCVACGAPAATPTPAVAPPPTSAPSPAANAAPVDASRADLLNAANAAYRSANLSAAIELYQRVVNTPSTGEPAAASAAIDGLARFRAMLALLQAGREDDARAELSALQTADANAPMARLATQLWDQYGMVGDVRGACAQLQPQIATQAGPALSTLQGLGVGVDAQSLCSLPGG
jgi:hypothetical protein